MNKTPKMQEIETERNMPIEDLLQSLYLKHRRQTDVAKELGITQSTLSYWLMKLKLEERVVLVGAGKGFHVAQNRG